jgi:hypothetical protein
VNTAFLTVLFFCSAAFAEISRDSTAPQYVGFYRGAQMATGIYGFTDLTDPLGTSTRIGSWPFPAPTYETIGFDGASYFVLNRGTTYGGPGLNRYNGAKSFASISGSQACSDWHGIGACNGVYYGLYSGTGLTGAGLYLFMDPTDPANTAVRLFEDQTFSSNAWTDVAFDGERYLFVRNDSDGGTPGVYQYDPDHNDFLLVSGTETYSDWQGLGVFDADLVPVHNKKAYVLLFGGQSNALGWGYRQYLLDTGNPLAMLQDDIDFLYQKPYDSAGMLPENTLMPLQSGNSNSNVKKIPNHYPALTQAPVSRFGPELNFARRVRDLISEPDSRLGVMKFASGGSSLYDLADWRPDGTANRSADGRLYQIFQHTAWRCIGAMKNKYPTHEVEVLGMAWVQGESDALEGQGAQYEENLTRLVADVRATFGANLAFVLNKISMNQIAGTVNTNKLVQWPMVMAAQDAVAAADPKVVATETEGENYEVSTGLAEGQYHYTTASLLQIGDDLARALVSVSGVDAAGDGRQSAQP